jgi:S-(hydroxymethyl)glutathione dehydrogenase/alcohol dehydrogenase
MVKQYLDDDIKVDEMVTHMIGLEGINKTFGLMHEGASIRLAIHF